MRSQSTLEFNTKEELDEYMEDKWPGGQSRPDISYIGPRILEDGTYQLEIVRWPLD